MIDNKKLTLVLEKFPWYDTVWEWYNQGLVTEKEIENGVNYLAVLKK